MSTMTRVREAIENSHQAIEQTEFAKSLLDGRISRPAYCHYLAQMWHIHYQLEHTLPNLPNVGGFFELSMVRTPAIERDLFALGSAVELQQRLTCTQTIEQQLVAWARSAPFGLLGCCYILEGSRMGSLMIGRALIQSLRLQPPVDASAEACIPGVEYHLQDAAHTPRRVKQLKSAIDAAALSDAQEQELTLGACAFMSMLNELYSQLPVDAGVGYGRASVCPVHGLSPAVASPAANLRSA